MRLLLDVSAKMSSWRLVLWVWSSEGGTGAPQKVVVSEPPIHSMKSEANSRVWFRPGAGFLKAHILAAPARGFSSCPPEAIS